MRLKALDYVKIHDFLSNFISGVFLLVLWCCWTVLYCCNKIKCKEKYKILQLYCVIGKSYNKLNKMYQLFHML